MRDKSRRKSVFLKALIFYGQPIFIRIYWKSYGYELKGFAHEYQRFHGSFQNSKIDGF